MFLQSLFIVKLIDRIILERCFLLMEVYVNDIRLHRVPVKVKSPISELSVNEEERETRFL